MEFIGILILIFMLIAWENILALPVFVIGVILLIKLRKKRLENNAKTKEEKELKQVQIEQEIKEKVAKGEIIYKDAFIIKENKEYNISTIRCIMTVKKFEELLKDLKTYMEKFRNTEYYRVLDAFGNVSFDYKEYICAARSHGLYSPIFTTDKDYGAKLTREVAVIKKILDKEYKDLTDTDISRLLKWSEDRQPGCNFITDIDNKNLYSVELINPKCLKRSMSYLNEIKELNSKLNNYKDLFGNEIIFKDIQ